MRKRRTRRILGGHVGITLKIYAGLPIFNTIIKKMYNLCNIDHKQQKDASPPKVLHQADPNVTNPHKEASNRGNKPRKGEAEHRVF